MPKRPLEAIFFDIDDTLYSTTSFAGRARRAAVDAMCRAGLRMDPEAVGRMLDDIVTELSSNSDRHYDALLAQVGPEVYAPVNPAVIVASGVAAYHDTKMRELAPFEDAAEVLKGLAERGVRMGVITAGRAVKQAEKLVRLGVLPWLDPGAVFITGQLDYSKGDVDLYRWVSETLGLAPGRCMLVGDDPRFDVDPPHEADWITVQSRRGGRHEDNPSRFRPDYSIKNFYELRDIIDQEFIIVHHGDTETQR